MHKITLLSSIRIRFLKFFYLSYIDLTLYILNQLTFTMPIIICKHYLYNSSVTLLYQYTFNEYKLHYRSKV